MSKWRFSCSLYHQIQPIKFGELLNLTIGVFSFEQTIQSKCNTLSFWCPFIRTDAALPYTYHLNIGTQLHHPVLDSEAQKLSYIKFHQNLSSDAKVRRCQSGHSLALYAQLCEIFGTLHGVWVCANNPIKLQHIVFLVSILKNEPCHILATWIHAPN